MWGSGAARRRRQLALKEMVAAATATQRYAAPWRSSPAVWQHFNNESEILTHLLKTWRNALAGAVYVAIEQGGLDHGVAVKQAFETISRRHRGVRQILEAHQEHPAISAAMRKEAALLDSLVEGGPLSRTEHVARLVAAA